jgi:hypothetical protein
VAMDLKLLAKGGVVKPLVFFYRLLALLAL